MKRLEAALELLRPCKVLADVGCDHGLLCGYALNSGKAQRVYACDVSAPSLDKARKLLPWDKAEFFLTDGLNGVPLDFDMLSLCGMGAALMLKITACYDKDAAVLMQPQNHAPLVRQVMTCQRGYRLAAETLAFERGKFYPVMLFERGAGRLDDLQLKFGLNAHKPSGELIDYCLKLKQKYSRYPLTPTNAELLSSIEEVLNAGNG